MRRRDDPAIRDERATTAKFAREKSTFYQRHLPGMWTEARRVSTHNAIRTCVYLAATCNQS